MSKVIFAPKTVEEDTLGSLISQRRVSVASTSSESGVPPLYQHERRSSTSLLSEGIPRSPPQRRVTLGSWPANSNMPLRWWEKGNSEQSIHVAMDHFQFGL